MLSAEAGLHVRASRDEQVGWNIAKPEADSAYLRLMKWGLLADEKYIVWIHTSLLRLF